ncbi:sugar ABC transporter ATP-binding protein [Mesorhizobium sp. CN2-181]|uniref:sugar ABC transporter ATP-binding protein n=1 Tax=Mesorhizobium yinganensis TaxID=3157707 RepID=UPI0032B74155
MSPGAPILSLRGIRKSYGPTEVLHGVDFDVHPGEVVALLGENGAGKSTLSNIIAGSISPSAGQMTWLGRPYAPANPREALDLGIGLIHQELRLLPNLTIAENVHVGRYPIRSGLVDRARMNRDAAEQLRRLGLNLPATRRVAGLSTANQQLIEIAKALARDARLLILDEPTAALGGAEVDLLFGQIEKLRSEGVGIIYISHRLEEIRRITDRIVVMRDGSKVQEFDKGDVPVRTIVEAMVGRSLERMFPAMPEPKDEVTLSVEGLTSPEGDFRDVSFTVRRGEILGIAGLVGAGRTELVRAITGADPLAAGKVKLDGADITLRHPWEAIRHGIVLVPEDRKQQGLILDHSIAENIGYCNREAVSSGMLISARRLREFAAANIRRFGVKGTGRQNAGEMSGGNQQKVVLAKWLARDPKVVVLDEPTRGIDVGARSSIYEIIRDLAAEGRSVIVVSSDLEEVLGVSHRIVVLSKGRQAGILSREEASDVSVMELATS